jgi:hypothetical protein
MRLMRGLGSHLLPCGCLAGIYETYAGSTVAIVDGRGEFCTLAKHRPGEAIEAAESDGAGVSGGAGSARTMGGGIGLRP